MSYGPGVVASPTANIHDGGFGLRLDRRKALGAAVGCSVALSGLARPSVAAPGVRTLVSPDQLSAAYDYVIIGAGSAGCVLAHRLGRAARRVLLVEAGGPANLAAIANPPDWPELQGSQVDWRYSTIPQAGLAGRAVPYPRGKVVGGSSAINALAYQRGHPAAYTIAGLRDGVTRTFCHISSAPKRFPVAPAPGTAAMVRCTCSR